jgi:hypothetical protein
LKPVRLAVIPDEELAGVGEVVRSSGDGRAIVPRDAMLKEDGSALAPNAEVFFAGA